MLSLRGLAWEKEYHVVILKVNKGEIPCCHYEG